MPTNITPQGAHSPNGGDDPRKRYTLEFKLNVLKEACAPGASIAAVARRHDINTNVVFRWRKLFREGRLGGAAAADGAVPSVGLVPIRLVPDAAAQEFHSRRKIASEQAGKDVPAGSGVMHIIMPGGFGLRIEGNVDDAALRRVLRAVRDIA